MIQSLLAYFIGKSTEETLRFPTEGGCASRFSKVYQSMEKHPDL